MQTTLTADRGGIATSSPYHPALHEMLSSHPAKGRGHTWLFRVAVHLRHYHTAEACFRLLRACADEWDDRNVPDSEIQSAVLKAYGTPRGAAHREGPRWPLPCSEAIEKVVRSTKPAFGLDPVDIGAHKILPALFQQDELVCVGLEKGDAAVSTLQEVLPNASRFQFIVPSPMTARHGANQQGRRTCRCLANTGPRRFLVIECDGLGKPEQAAVLTRLSSILPLVLVVDSGGKSLHGWFRAAGLPEAELAHFMQYATHLGADKHTWVRCQLVRMPGGTRYRSGVAPRVQPIVYVDPQFLKGV